MDFKFIKTAFSVSAILLIFSSCTPIPNDVGDNENIIGNKLQSVTSLRASDGSQKANIAMFDETTRKIHQFDLNGMVRTRTLEVSNPLAKHYVLHDAAGNFIIDFSLKHLSIIDKNSYVQIQPIQFLGKPVSASFRPELGFLVMYDDLKTVGMIQLNSNGIVEKAKTFGSVVDGENTIAAGDMTEAGKLVLALSNDSLVILDVAQNLAASAWTIESIQNPSLSKITWVAPVPKMPSLILIKSDTKVTLYNITTQQILSSLDIAKDRIEKLSKTYDPHLIERLTQNSIRLIYSDGVSIKTRTVFMQSQAILTSELDVTSNTWSFVELAGYGGFSLYNDVNQVRESRHLKKFRITDLQALQSVILPDRAQINLSSDFYFALYPSELGYAEKVSLSGSEKRVVKHFNLKKY